MWLQGRWGWVPVGGGGAAGGMNALAPGSVVAVSTNSGPVALGDRTLRSSTTPPPAAATSSTTSTAINRLRFDPVAGGTSVARCRCPTVDGTTGVAPVAATWVSWSWIGAAERSDPDDACPGRVGQVPGAAQLTARGPTAPSTALDDTVVGFGHPSRTSSPAGTPACRSRRARVVMCATAICSRLRPGNGSSPTATHTAHRQCSISARASGRTALEPLGGQQDNVPSIAPVFDSPVSPAACASEIDHDTQWRLSSTKMFDGLTSREPIPPHGGLLRLGDRSMCVPPVPGPAAVGQHGLQVAALIRRISTNSRPSISPYVWIGTTFGSSSSTPA